jgi:hypothetical protein
MQERQNNNKLSNDCFTRTGTRRTIKQDTPASQQGDPNPLACLHPEYPPTPLWGNLRGAVLTRAKAFENDDLAVMRTKLVERAQFTTAIALFIVIACCIVGLLVPMDFAPSDPVLACGTSQGAGIHEPALASFQHP